MAQPRIARRMTPVQAGLKTCKDYRLKVAFRSNVRFATTVSAIAVRVATNG